MANLNMLYASDEKSANKTFIFHTFHLEGLNPSKPLQGQAMIYILPAPYKDF